MNVSECDTRSPLNNAVIDLSLAAYTVGFIPDGAEENTDED